VQRWEREEGLPVHRLSHDKRGTVYAYQSELDGWWESRSRTTKTSTDLSEINPAMIPPMESAGVLVSSTQTPAKRVGREWTIAALAVVVLTLAGTWFLDGIPGRGR